MSSYTYWIGWSACVLALLSDLCSSLEVLQTVHGTIGGENYTYYRMSRPDRLLIEVESLDGDADIFVSSETLKPTFDDYEIQSTSCGKDVIEIPETFPRPFGVGIYGHFLSQISTYKVTVYLMDKENEMDYAEMTHLYYDYEAAQYLFNNYEASDYMFRDAKPGISQKAASAANTDSGSSSMDDSLDEDDSEGSILWQILIILLKVVFEIIN